MTSLSPSEMRDLATISETAQATYKANQRVGATMTELVAIPIDKALESIYGWAGQGGDAAARAKRVRAMVTGIIERQAESRKLIQALNKELNAAVSASDEARARRFATGPTLNI